MWKKLLLLLLFFHIRTLSEICKVDVSVHMSKQVCGSRAEKLKLPPIEQRWMSVWVKEKRCVNVWVTHSVECFEWPSGLEECYTNAVRLQFKFPQFLNVPISTAITSLCGAVEREELKLPENMKQCSESLRKIFTKRKESKVQSFISTALTVAKKTMLLIGGDGTKLTKPYRLRLLTEHTSPEKLASTLKDILIPSHNAWSPLLQFT